MQTCTHLDQIRDVEPSAQGCEECLSRGHVGCCDSQQEQTRHQALPRQRTPDRGFVRARRWYYADEALV